MSCVHTCIMVLCGEGSAEWTSCRPAVYSKQLLSQQSCSPSLSSALLSLV